MKKEILNLLTDRKNITGIGVQGITKELENVNQQPIFNLNKIRYFPYGNTNQFFL